MLLGSKDARQAPELTTERTGHRRFTPADLEMLLAAGIFAEALELVDGLLHEPASGAPHRFTVEEYYRLAELGVFYDERVELLDGEVLEAPRRGHRHIGCVNALNHFLTRYLGNRAIVSVQNSFVLSEHSAPLPDLAILAWRDDFYRGRIPQPEDALLVIEVADTSCARDRRLKLPPYAAAGVVEVWIVDLERQQIETYLDPAAGAYRTAVNRDRTSTLSPRLLPDLALEGSKILG